MLWMNNDVTRAYPVSDLLDSSQDGFLAEYTTQTPISEFLLADQATQLRNTFPNPARYRRIPSSQGAIGHDSIYDENIFEDIK